MSFTFSKPKYNKSRMLNVDNAKEMCMLIKHTQIALHACVLSHFRCVQPCDPMDCSPPGSSIHEILQARILEWAAMPSSRGHLPDLGIKPTSPAYPTLKVSCVPLSHWESPPRPQQQKRMKCVKILTNSSN